MAYQINFTGQEIDERLQNIGTAKDVAAADGTLYARISKNADDIDELSDAVGHINTAQTATDKTVTQHTADISTLQTAVGDVKKDIEDAGQAMAELSSAMEMPSASAKFAPDPTNPVAVFKINNNDVLLFAGDSHIDYTFKLFRHTSRRYEEYPLWVQDPAVYNKRKKIPYTIHVDKTSIDTFKPLNIQYGETTESLRTFVLNYPKRKKWAIQAYVNGYPYTPLFEFAIVSNEITLRYDLDGSITRYEYRLKKNNGARYTPRRQNIRLNYAYNSYYWDKVGDVEWGLMTERRYNFSVRKESCYYKMPVAGDIVHRDNKAEGTVMYVNPKADDTFEMVWSEDKRVYTMEFSTYIFKDPNGIECPGMRITKAATLICDDITNQTKGGTLRDLYISAGAKYNEATGYYELNGLTNITEEEMREIYIKTWGWWLKLPQMQGFGDTSVRTNIPCPDYKAVYYSLQADLSSIFGAGAPPDNLEVLNFIPTYVPSDTFKTILPRYLNWAFQGSKKLRTILGVFDVTYIKETFNIGGNIETISIKNLASNVRFYQSTRLSKESILYMINNSNATSNITIDIKDKALYDTLRADADIIAALAEHTFITLVNS